MHHSARSRPSTPRAALSWPRPRRATPRSARCRSRIKDDLFVFNGTSVRRRGKAGWGLLLEVRAPAARSSSPSRTSCSRRRATRRFGRSTRRQSASSTRLSRTSGAVRGLQVATGQQPSRPASPHPRLCSGCERVRRVQLLHLRLGRPPRGQRRDLLLRRRPRNADFRRPRGRGVDRQLLQPLPLLLRAHGAASCVLGAALRSADSY